MQSEIKKAVLDKIRSYPSGIYPTVILGALSHSVQEIFVAVFELEREREIVLRGGLFFIAPKQSEILFKDVKPGEEFEFTLQLLAARAIKAEFAKVHVVPPDAESERSCTRCSNLVILEILPHQKNVSGRKPGDYEWLPDSGIVLVRR